MKKGFVFCLVCMVLAASAHGAATKIRINEVFYETDVDPEISYEAIELYVVSGGFDPSNWYVSDMDTSANGGNLTIPTSCPTVTTGDLIVMHLGAGTNDDVGPVYHYYFGKTTTTGVLSNSGEPIVLFEDTNTTHSWTADPVHDLMVFEGPSDADLATMTSWAGWPNNGVDPTDAGKAANTDCSLQLIGSDLDNSSNWFPLLPTIGAPNTCSVQWCNTLADVRAKINGSVVGVTSTVHTPIGPINYERRNFFLQDSTAGICVDNSPELTTRSYAAGDVVVVTGTLRTSGGIRQLMLLGDPGAPTGTAALQAVQPLTVEAYRDSVWGGTDEYGGELISFNDVIFDTTSPPTIFASNTVYQIREEAGPVGSASAFLFTDDGCELIGQAAPTGSFSVTGEASRNNLNPRIVARYLSDLVVNTPTETPTGTPTPTFTPTQTLCTQVRDFQAYE